MAVQKQGGQLEPRDSSSVRMRDVALETYRKRWTIGREAMEGQGYPCWWRDKMMKCYSILFTNPSARAGYDTRSIFKRNLTGLNSEFSFS